MLSATFKTHNEIRAANPKTNLPDNKKEQDIQPEACSWGHTDSPRVGQDVRRRLFVDWSLRAAQSRKKSLKTLQSFDASSLSPTHKFCEGHTVTATVMATASLLSASFPALHPDCGHNTVCRQPQLHLGYLCNRTGEWAKVCRQLQLQLQLSLRLRLRLRL